MPGGVGGARPADVPYPDQEKAIGKEGFEGSRDVDRWYYVATVGERASWVTLEKYVELQHKAKGDLR